jgi:DNA-binding NarL/FixJ family response regulator
MAGARRTGVIVDQHPLLLQAVESVLARTGVTMVGKALSGERALRLVHDRQPDHLVTELQLSQGKLDGIGLVSEARWRSPNLKAIVLSAVDDPARIAEALRPGAAAYVIKTVHPDDLATAIRQAFKHSLFLADSLPPTLSLISRGEQNPPELTRRELEISAARRQGPFECRGGANPLGDGADGEVPPLERLSQAERLEPNRGEPLGARPRTAAQGAGRGGIDLGRDGAADPARRTLRDAGATQGSPLLMPS